MKVSIITICYNCQEDLEKTIISVISQTYSDKEYIIIDGGSTDGSTEVLKHYNDKIDILISEPDNGIYDALNKGVRLATGEWIICLNAGDIFTSEHILSNIFNQEIPQSKSFIYSDFYLYHNDGTRELHKTNREKGEIHHQNAIYRKSLHQQYGYYIVTHPYIVSDLLFFLAIPASQYLKISTPIAFVKDGGVSNGLWCAEQSWAAKVIYGMDTIPMIFYRDIRLRFGLWRQKVIKTIFKQ
ncbi:MAG: glycosyltransferase [Prevotella sp.]|nr:glycosyltransferase [Prevotella sp.]